MAETTKVPAIYGAMGEVLTALKVDKNGVLPGNMGGKPYITAADASAAVKNLFADNHIIILPVEKVIRYESIIDPQGKARFVVAIEGTYTLVSTVDGSIVTVGAVGDGTALGTSVASNIASTNALKNALLRTFLITEQTVEEEAKSGSEKEQNPGAQAKIAAAHKAPAVSSTDTPSQAVIRKEWIVTSKMTGARANELREQAEAEGLKGEAAYKWVLDGLTAGTLKAEK